MLQRRPVAVPTPTADSAGDARRRHLLSDAFAERLTEHMERAAARAVQAHRDAGHPVHGVVDGRLVTVPPPAET